MCKQGDMRLVTVDRGYQVSVDSCIAELVQKLNDAGIDTSACCCGHGKKPGNIILRDGRELFIAANYEQAREFSNKFPKLN